MSFTVTRTLNITKYYPQIGLYVESGTEDVSLTYSVNSIANVDVTNSQATVIYEIEDGSGNKVESLAFTFTYSDISSILTEAESAIESSIS